MKNYTISLVVGDWSGDGHGKSETLTYISNLTNTEIAEAYKSGTKIVGFDFSEEACKGYGDYIISPVILKKLNKHGIYEKDFTNEWCELFAEVYLKIAKIGNTSLVVSRAKNDNRLNIGGYGLFE